MTESDNEQRHKNALLLAQRIAEMPCLQKKLLAMYYFENLALGDIAACLALGKMRTCQILAETVHLLRSSFSQITSPDEKTVRKS
jgi:RNA polymerase sigma factor for flagellar operon FliA